MDFKSFDIYSDNLKKEFQENQSIAFYSNYSEFVKTCLDKNPLNLDELTKLVSNLRYKTKIEDYLTNLKDNYFDLLFLARILHYEEIDTNHLIRQSSSELSDNGLLYISFPMNSGRQKIDLNDITSIIENLDLFILERIIDNDSVYLYCRKKSAHNN